MSLIRQSRLRDIIETNQRLAADFSELQSTIMPRLQQIERELLSPKLGRFFAELHVAVELIIRQGLEAAASIENGCRAMVAPLARGKAGGIARASSSWRHLDGTFMSEAERRDAIEAFELKEYERYATGGRARAASAQRTSDGRFC